MNIQVNYLKILKSTKTDLYSVSERQLIWECCHVQLDIFIDIYFFFKTITMILHDNGKESLSLTFDIFQRITSKK